FVQIFIHLFYLLFFLVGHWCYRTQKCEQPQCKDPPQWHQVSDWCKGNRQSPVNIVTRNVVYDKNLKALTFEGYDVKDSAKWTLENNGHTGNASPKVGGGGLKRKYKAVEFHLHWGVPGEPQTVPGSEHSIDGQKYPMELHVVHIREDASDVTEAKKTTDGLAVLAFFIEAGKENKNYATLLSELEKIKYRGKSTQVNALPLSSLLPAEEELGRFYRYEGSLTSPDCYQGVTWTVFEKPVELNVTQLSLFSALHFEGPNSTAMTENFRPVQPLNDREVLWSGSAMALPEAKLLLLLALSCALSSV
ncbi:CAH4 anhydrase, partial [Sylvia atricapilla]|nr:CAH4 anhydrase [Sylvia atricapilla]